MSNMIDALVSVFLLHFGGFITQAIKTVSVGPLNLTPLTLDAPLVLQVSQLD